ncbi:MAG: hypothetical protein U0O39_10950, partial [Akkermansia sp.]
MIQVSLYSFPAVSFAPLFGAGIFRFVIFRGRPWIYVMGGMRGTYGPRQKLRNGDAVDFGNFVCAPQ